MEISRVASLYMKLSNKQIAEVLVRLSGCTDWSGPLFFANNQRQIFSSRPYYIHKIYLSRGMLWEFYN